MWALGSTRRLLPFEKLVPICSNQFAGLKTPRPLDATQLLEELLFSTPSLQNMKRKRPGDLNQRKEAIREGTVGWQTLSPGCDVAFFPDILGEDGWDLYHSLQEEVKWLEREVTVMGRKVLQPRLIAYYATTPDMTYTYSGLTLQPCPFEGVMLQLKNATESFLHQQFNSCLLNYYRNGDDHISWHSDNEKIYGSTPFIASLSLGCSRDFVMKNNKHADGKIVFKLGQGDLFVMKGDTQNQWLHSVPKRANVSQGRVNLTFRNVLYVEKSRRR